MTLFGPTLDASIDLGRLLEHQVANTPDEWAVMSSTRRLTWSELDSAADRWASALAEHGLTHGDRVASLMPNRVDLLIHYLGCARAGVVAVPLNYRYVGPQIDHALEVSGATMLLAHVERENEVRSSSWVASLPIGCVWYDDDPLRANSAAFEPTFDELLNRAASSRRPDTKPSDPAFIFFTSGSTGPAKGVTHTRETMGWMMATAVAAFDLTDRDIFLPASSMSHLGSFLWSMSSVSVGARVVVARNYDGDELLPLIREARPTVLAMIPAALAALIRDHDVTKDDFASFRVCRCGADHVPFELNQEFSELAGFPIDEGYGMTEVGLATLNPPAGPIKQGSIGKTVPGFSISVRDDDGVETAVDTVGRIWMKTSSATIGYWENPDATSVLFEDGWLDSGDLARRDGDGYLWFFGRAKQIIVHDGSNISPQEVEDALSEHPSVAGVGVVGIHDVLHGEDVRAYVTLIEGRPRPTSQELIRFARERVGYRAPEEIVFLDELPLNPTGKVDRVGLKRMAEDHRNPHRPG